jgi:hypothetical protein
MRQTKCPTCDCNVDIIGFDRDDPVMACGHKLTIDAQLERDEIKEGIKFIITTEANNRAKALHIPYLEAEQMVLREVFGY